MFLSWQQHACLVGSSYSATECVVYSNNVDIGHFLGVDMNMPNTIDVMFSSPTHEVWKGGNRKGRMLSGTLQSVKCELLVKQ